MRRLPSDLARTGTLLAILSACGKSDGRPSVESTPGYYLFSYTVQRPDTQHVQGVVRISSNDAGELTGRAWVDSGVKTLGASVLALHDLRLSRKGELVFAIGTVDVIARFKSDSRAEGLWTGTVQSTRFGALADWPATLAKQRELLGGVYLFDLHYSVDSQLGWDQAILTLTDSSSETLGLAGHLERFLAVPGSDTPYLRQGPALAVTAHLSLSPALSFRFDLPLLPARVQCSGDIATPAGLAGRCAFGPSAGEQIPFTLWRIPSGWQFADRTNGATEDTLYSASYIRDRFFNCEYLTPRYVRTPTLHAGSAYVPCFGISGPDALWSEPELLIGEHRLAPKHPAANLFVVGGLLMLSHSILFAVDSDTALYAYSRDSLLSPTFVYGSPASLRILGGDAFAVIVYDYAGRVLRVGHDLKVNALPPLPRRTVDSAYVVAAGFDSSGTYIIAISHDTLMAVLHYNGTTWKSRSFVVGYRPDWRTAVQLRDTLYALRSSFRGRDLITIALRQQHLDSLPLLSPEPVGPIGAESFNRLSGMLVLSDGSLHLITEYERVLYRIGRSGNLVPVLDLRIPTDSVPIPSRSIIDVSARHVLLDGGLRLVRRGRP